MTERQDRISEVMASWTDDEAFEYQETAETWARKIANGMSVFDDELIDELAFHALADVIPDSIARYRRSEDHTAAESTYAIAACKQGLPRKLTELLERTNRMQVDESVEAEHKPNVRLTRHRERVGTYDRRPTDRVPEGPADTFPIHRMLCNEVARKVEQLPSVKLGDADKVDPKTGRGLYHAGDCQVGAIYLEVDTTRRMIQYDQACDAHVGFFDDELLIECLAVGEKQYVIAELMGVGKNDVTDHKKRVADRFEVIVG